MALQLCERTSVEVNTVPTCGDTFRFSETFGQDILDLWKVDHHTTLIELHTFLSSGLRSLPKILPSPLVLITLIQMF